jgi:hypothetical protein
MFDYNYSQHKRLIWQNKNHTRKNLYFPRKCGIVNELCWESAMSTDDVNCNTAYANLMSNTAFKKLMALGGKEQNAAALSLINSFVPDFEKDPVRSLTPVAGDKEVGETDDNKKRFLCMDFQAVTDHSEPVEVEVQVHCHILFDERALAYAASPYLQQLEQTSIMRGGWFRHLHKTYAIQFLGYDSNRILGIKDDEIEDQMVARVREHPMKKGAYIKWFVFTDKFSGQQSDRLQLIQVEVPRARSAGVFPGTRDLDQLQPAKAGGLKLRLQSV